MTEKKIPARLSKAANEFNISTKTIVLFLSKRGFIIEENPNTRISPEMYTLLVKEFQPDRVVKEESRKLNIDTSDYKSLTIEDKKKHEEEEVYNERSPYLTIHTTSIDKAEPVAKEEKPKPAPPEPARKPEPPEEKVEEKAAGTKKKPAKKTKATAEAEEAETKPRTKTRKEPQVEAEKPVEAEGPQPRILGKIDLDKINQKTKPGRKTSEEKKKEKEARKGKAGAKKTKVKPKAEETALPAVPPIVEETIPDQADIVSAPAGPAIVIKEEVKPAEESRENFIPTDYVKLEGPKILDKIELPEPKKLTKKLVASSKDEEILFRKKKRKRIRKGEGETQGGAAKTDKPKVKTKEKDRKVRKDRPKTEVSEEDVQKQIRETLSKLTTTHKSKAAKYRREKRLQVSQLKQQEQLKIEEDKSILKVTEFVTANELATMMDIPVNQVIATCLTLGLFVSINQRLDAETISLLAEEFGYKVEFVSLEVSEAIHDREEEEDEGTLAPRAPIVTVMGHVDHGKTKLLDYIRNTNVVAGEAGGITQHIGAYEVTLDGGKKITFLDTPGHEAFTAMRARGAKVTDLVIIVIAADDSVMPQTVEAINHAQAAGVPIVFAINKIDLPASNPDRIREQLSKMNILVEEWGGKYQCQEIAAKQGTNVKMLLEKVIVEAEMLDLKANPDKHAKGTVLESSLEKGEGYVAKMLVQDGTLRIGDVVLAGTCHGKVKAMKDERRNPIHEAGPSTPVLLLGLNGAPQAGDSFNVMKDEKEVKGIANKRMQLQREQGLRTQKHITLDEIGRRIAVGDFKELNIIVKGDVDGSVEALSDSLLKLTNEQVQVNVIHKSVGPVTESDVLLASASDAIIVGFQVRPSLSARKLAEQEQIDIRLYSIIYQAIEEIKQAIEGMLSPEIVEKITCNIEVRDVFKISKVGTVAGCMVLDGVVNRHTKIRIIRDGIVVYTGLLGSLKRFKDDVKEVKSGYECGLNIQNYNDIKVGDIIEGYEEVEVKRKL